jgi:DNA repair exonuclease SbcCD ATPase subunit
MKYDEELIDDDITVERIRLQDKKYHLLQVIKEYEDIDDRCGRTYNELLMEKKELEMKIKDNNDKNVKMKMYMDEIDNIDKRLLNIKIEDNPEDICKEIERRKKEIKDGEERVRKWRDIKKINEEKRELEEKRSKLIIMEQDVQNLSQLKYIANEVEHITMKNVIDTINNYINEILVMIFENPITVEFSVYKVNKSNSIVKPSINLKILYRGYEIDSLSSLSGGEADRVSLAVTLALSKFSSCPIILLDEFAAGLDVATKELVIKSIRSSSEGKMIMCISHDTVEGIYDFVEKM